MSNAGRMLAYRLLLVAGAVAAASVTALLVLSVLVASWAATLQTPAEITDKLRERELKATAVVFFDEDVQHTLPRARKAIELARAGVVDRIFLVGGARPERNFYGSPELQQALRGEQGYSDLQWIADRSSRDTVSNLREVRRWFQSARPQGSVLFVSDCYHLYRIQTLLQDGELAARVGWICEAGGLGVLHHIRRLVWEMGAWTSLILPAGLRDAMLEATRS